MYNIHADVEGIVSYIMHLSMVSPPPCIPGVDVGENGGICCQNLS